MSSKPSKKNLLKLVKPSERSVNIPVDREGEPKTPEIVNTIEAVKEISTVDTLEQFQAVEPEKLAQTTNPAPIFQGIGIIVGEVVQKEGLYSVLLNSKRYPLLPKKPRTIEALKKEIENTSNPVQRLVVYPKVIHFPSRDKPYQILFQLVGFDRGRDKDAVSGELLDGEFKLSGLWQFIPVCRTPCISIFRNFSKDRLDYIKQLEPAKKVKFLKGSHLPILWKDASVAPFRFNPKAEKEEQGHPAFVQIKAKFLPQRDMFGFVSELAPHQENAPRFMKVSKEDKAKSVASKKKEEKK